MRNIDYDFEADCDCFDELTTYTYTVSHFDFMNMTLNPRNTIYDINVTGLSNTTALLGANSFISMGHYFGVNKEAETSMPVIVDKEGRRIEGNFNDDVSYIGVEAFTGATL